MQITENEEKMRRKMAFEEKTKRNIGLLMLTTKRNGGA